MADPIPDELRPIFDGFDQFASEFPGDRRGASERATALAYLERQARRVADLELIARAALLERLRASGREPGLFLIYNSAAIRLATIEGDGGFPRLPLTDEARAALSLANGTQEQGEEHA